MYLVFVLSGMLKGALLDVFEACSITLSGAFEGNFLTQSFDPGVRTLTAVVVLQRAANSFRLTSAQGHNKSYTITCPPL